jgi:hypothetical protein
MDVLKVYWVQQQAQILLMKIFTSTHFRLIKNYLKIELTIGVNY